MNEFIFRSIIESWVNCEKCDISKEIKEPQKLITDDELRKQTEKKEYLAIFKDFMHKYIDAIRVERGCYCFLVLNEELTILDIFYPRWININGHCTFKKYLKSGVSFCSKKTYQRMIIIDHGMTIYDGSVEKIKDVLGKERTLAVDFGEEYNEISLSGVELIKQEEKKMWFKFNKDEVLVSNLIFSLTQKYVINDLTMQEPEIEAIVREIYQGGKGKYSKRRYKPL
jgi:hypothetical protein